MPAPAKITGRGAASRAGRGVLLAGAGAGLLLPLVVIVCVLGFFSQAQQQLCSAGVGGSAVPAGAAPPDAMPPALRALYLEPLQLQRGRWYEVGSTYYAAGDSTGSGHYGAIPDPAQANLDAHPDSFAELSTLTTNPYPNFRFEDANALGALPYMTALRVARGRRSVVVYKRDIGFGQGPKTLDGQRFRIDLWQPAAQALGVTSSLVKITLAPEAGAGNVLHATPDDAGVDPAVACSGLGAPAGPLPLTDGQRAKLLPNGLAAAPRDAPEPIKRMIAAGNQIVGKPYQLGGGHGQPLTGVWSTYDCSSSVEHLLYAGGFIADPSYTVDSGTLAGSWGQPGYGPLISVLANPDHVYLYVAGLRWDTHNVSAGDGPNPGIGWHLNTRDDIGFVARHPGGGY